MKTFKKALAVVMCVVLTLTAAPLSGFVGLKLPNLFDFKAEAATYSGTCGDNLTWSLDIDTGVLIIDGNGDIPDYSARSAPWYTYKDYITSVIVSDDVESIGKFAFYGLECLEEITLPFVGQSRNYEGSESPICVLGYIFGFSTEKSIHVYYYRPYFYYYSSEKTGVVCQYCTEDLNVGGTYYRQYYNYYIPDSLKKVTITDDNAIPTAAFKNCVNLTEININDEISFIGRYAFYNCDSLVSITIPSKITTIADDAFESCDNLTNVYYNANIESWCNISFDSYYSNGSTASGKSNLSNPMGFGKNFYINNVLQKDIVIPENVSSVSAYAFLGFDCLESITIPVSIKRIGNYAFYDCNNLKYIAYSGTEEDWKQITIGSEGISISSTTMFYESTGFLTTESSFDMVAYNNGVARIISYSGSETDVEIPAEYEDKVVVTIASDVFKNKTNIVSVAIPDSITSIESSAFYGCSGLKYVLYSGNEEDWNKIEIGTDNSCLSSAEIVFNTNEAKTNETGFSYALSDSEVIILSYSGTASNLSIPSEIDGKPVTAIGKNAFKGNVTISNLMIPASVTRIGADAFSDCSKLSNVYYAGDADLWCSIDFGSAKSNPLYYANNLYVGGSVLKTLEVGNEVAEIKPYVFYNYSKLTAVTAGKSTEKIGAYAFYGCSAVETVKLSKSVTEIGSSAFMNCSAIKTVNYGGTLTDWVSINFEDKTSNPISFSKALYIDGNKVTDIIILPDTKEIKPYAFYNYGTLTVFELPDSMEKVGKDAFYGCSVNEIKIPVQLVDAFTFSGLTKITITKGSGMMKDFTSSTYQNTLWYKNNSTLKTLVVEEGIENIGNYAFYNSKLVTTEHIPDSVKKIGNYAFYGCLAIKSVELSEKVTEIGMCSFSNCSYLTKISFGNNLKTIGESAFLSCSKLAEVVYGGNVADWVSINFANATANPIYYAKSLKVNDKKITKLVIPSSVEIINPYAFYNCTSLTSVHLFDGVKEIGEYAFYGCTGIEKFTAFGSLKRIGNSAFGNCSGLTSITYFGDMVDWFNVDVGSDNTPFSDVEVSFANGHIHSYEQSVEIESTCTSTGVMECYCICGDSYTEEIPIVDHTPGEWETSVEPGCISEGTKVKKCTVCGGVAETEKIDALGHSAGEWKITTYPTTTEEGVKTLYCSVCGDGYDTLAMPVLDAICDYLTWEITDEGYAEITGYKDGIGDDITLPATIYGYPVIIGDGAFAGCGITGVTIPEGVSTIGECAFAYCENLKAVNIPASVTKLGETAFVGSTNIERIDISADNESYATDEYGVIYNKDFTLLIYAPAKSVGEAYTMRSTTATACELSFADCTDFALTLSDGFSVDSNSIFFDVLSVSGFVTGNSCVNYKAIDGVLYNKAVTTLIKYPVDSKRELLIPPASVEYIADEYAFVTPEVEKSVIALFGLDYDSNTFNNMYREPEYLTVHIDSFYDFDSDSLVFLMMGPSHVCFGDTTKSENDQLNEIADNAIANIESQWEEKKDELTPGSIEYYYNEAFVLGYVDLITSYIDCQNDHTRLHKYAQVVETKDPTCAVDGYVNYACDCGYEFTDVITAPGHDYESVITEPTCTEKGFTTHICSVCGDTYTDSEVKENGHSYESVVTKVTCTTDGYTTHTCSVCKDSYTDSIVRAEGHKYDSVVTPNTCTKDGYTTHTCSVCEDTYTDSETKATGHSHESKVTKEPTCTNTGIRTFTCHCGDSYTEVIKANGHTKGEWEYIGGKEYAKSCTVCGDKLESKIVTVDMFFNSENVNKKQVLNKSTATVTATVTDNFVNDLVFTSSDSSTVYVDANGNVVANNIGKATITVTIKGTAISDSIEVEVLPRDFTVTWNVNGKQTKQTVKEEAKFTPNVNTTLKGYKFIGWDKTVPTTMPAENLTFTAQYELIVKQLKIKNPSTSTINYGETLVMHADFGGVELPEGWKIQWTVEGAGFDMAPAADGLTCKMTSVANGNATVKATLVDENGEAVMDANVNEMSDSKQLTSKAGFWQKFVSFFKNLFGISRVILQSI